MAWVPRLHGDCGNNINFALEHLADLSILRPFKGLAPAVCAGEQGWCGGGTAFVPWNLCFGQGQLTGEERRGGERSVKGERENKGRGVGEETSRNTQRSREDWRKG